MLPSVPHGLLVVSPLPTSCLLGIHGLLALATIPMGTLQCRDRFNHEEEEQGHDQKHVHDPRPQAADAVCHGCVKARPEFNQLYGYVGCVEKSCLSELF